VCLRSATTDEQGEYEQRASQRRTTPYRHLRGCGSPSPCCCDRPRVPPRIFISWEKLVALAIVSHDHDRYRSRPAIRAPRRSFDVSRHSSPHCSIVASPVIAVSKNRSRQLTPVRIHSRSNLPARSGSPHSELSSSNYGSRQLSLARIVVLIVLFDCITRCSIVLPRRDSVRRTAPRRPVRVGSRAFCSVSRCAMGRRATRTSDRAAHGRR
jgi:hypothetical protein